MKNYLQTLKDKLQSASKKKKLGKILFIGLLILLIVVISTIFWTKTHDNNKINCTTKIQEAESLRKNKKYQESSELLKSLANVCSGVSGDKKIQSSLPEQFIYKASQARTTYLAGDKKQAAQYAKEANKIDERMSVEEHDQVANLLTNELNSQTVFYDMESIIHGTYVTNRYEEHSQ